MHTQKRRLAIIGGTGISELDSLIKIKKHTIQTPYGPNSSPIIEMQFEGESLFFLARHGHPHKIAPHLINYRANIWALKELAVTDIIAINAVGGITSLMTSSSIVVPDQIIDYTHSRDASFFDGLIRPLQHIDFSYPYSQKLRKLLLQQSEQLIDGAVYGVTQGPRLETAAEILRLEHDGVDIVGMTAMPEAVLAREVNLNYASLCLVVNPAAGKSTELITMQQIYEVIESGMLDVKCLLNSFINDYYC